MGNNYTNPKYGYLYPLRPTGDICIIYDTYNDIQVYEIIIVTGKDRGKHKYVRRREIVLTKGRKPDIIDIESSKSGGYQIAEIWPDISSNN